jgi:hypothetical protein
VLTCGIDTGWNVVLTNQHLGLDHPLYNRDIMVSVKCNEWLTDQTNLSFCLLSNSGYIHGEQAWVYIVSSINCDYTTVNPNWHHTSHYEKKRLASLMLVAMSQKGTAINVCSSWSCHRLSMSSHVRCHVQSCPWSCPWSPLQKQKHSGYSETCGFKAFPGIVTQFKLTTSHHQSDLRESGHAPS